MVSAIIFGALWAAFLLTVLTFILMLLEKKGVSLFNVYLALVSFAALIGLVVGFGVAIHSTVTRFITTDDEFLMRSGRWEIQQCEASEWKPGAKPADAQVEVKKTEEQVKKCREEKSRDVLATRNVDFKETAVAGATWGLLFLVVFAFHFPKFLRAYRAE